MARCGFLDSKPSKMVCVTRANWSSVLVSVQLPGALESVLKTILHESLGEISNKAEQVD